MNLIPSPSAVLAGLLPVLASFHPQRAVDQTPTLVTSWQAPLETLRAELVNPFANPELTTPPRLREKEIPTKATTQAEAWVLVDVDAEGTPGQIRPVVIPPCVEGERCEVFEQIARQVARWDFEPGEVQDKEVRSRATVGIQLDWSLSSIQVARILYGPVAGDRIPAPVSVPEFSLDAAIAARTAAGQAAESPEDLVLPEALTQLPAPPNRSIDVDRRSVPVAGDLLVHLTPEGRVDRVLPVVIRPPVLWPFWKSVLSRWTFEPAKSGESPVGCWIRVELLDGKADLGGESKRIVSLKKNIPTPAAAAGAGKKP